jgi:hypothetical protein
MNLSVAGTPAFFEYLSRSDQEAYRSLQSRGSSADNRYKRNKRADILQRLLDEIKQFCIRDDSRDSTRSIVCGVCWLPNGRLATNIRQLQILFSKSKSAINGALAKLPYVIVPTKGDDWDQLRLLLPHIRGKYAEQREWTIRTQLENQDELPEPMDFCPDNPVPVDVGMDPFSERFGSDDDTDGMYGGYGPGPRAGFMDAVGGKYVIWVPPPRLFGRL